VAVSAATCGARRDRTPDTRGGARATISRNSPTTPFSESVSMYRLWAETVLVPTVRSRYQSTGKLPAPRPTMGSTCASFNATDQSRLRWSSENDSSLEASVARGGGEVNASYPFAGHAVGGPYRWTEPPSAAAAAHTSNAT